MEGKIKVSGKTTEELVALANENGVELTDEQLEAVAGGSWSGNYVVTCESCGRRVPCEEEDVYVYCTKCGYKNGPFKV